MPSSSVFGVIFSNSHACSIILLHPHRSRHHHLSNTPIHDQWPQKWQELVAPRALLGSWEKPVDTGAVCSPHCMSHTPSCDNPMILGTVQITLVLRAALAMPQRCVRLYTCVADHLETWLQVLSRQVRYRHQIVWCNSTFMCCQQIRMDLAWSVIVGTIGGVQNCAHCGN